MQAIVCKNTYTKSYEAAVEWIMAGNVPVVIIYEAGNQVKSMSPMLQKNNASTFEQVMDHITYN